MPRKVEEKLQQHPSLLQKDDLKCRELIGDFKKSIDRWFINGADDDDIGYGEIKDTCVEIILHGMQQPSEMLLQHQMRNKEGGELSDSSPPIIVDFACYGDADSYAFLKRTEDFEWIINAVNIHSSTTKRVASASTPPPASFLNNNTSPLGFSRRRQRYGASVGQSQQLSLKSWLKTNLHKSILCGFMQYLISDKELLDEHYAEVALLRQEVYANALVIGLSAVETHQYGLLSQIDELLRTDGNTQKGHKRSTSQPNVIVPAEVKTVKSISTTLSSSSRNCLPVIRKIRSLPEFRKYDSENCDVTVSRHRPRCKTLAGLSRITPNNPNFVLQTNAEGTRTVQSPKTFAHCDIDQMPSTSHNSSSMRSYKVQNLHLESNTFLTSASTSSSASSSVTSSASARRINLINTDNIKIWTDSSCERNKQDLQPGNSDQTAAQFIPKCHKLTGYKSSKSVSPLNSLFSSWFSTPPSYTSWYTDHQSSDEDNLFPETAVESIKSDFTSSTMPSHTKTPPSLSSTVFDSFIPTYGKKLQKRHNQNLFDDVSSSNEFSNPELLNSSRGLINKNEASPRNVSVTEKATNSQSLTRFLQMSNKSRNNTELDRENAHFRISEAIISAIEHIKWNKQEPGDASNNQATPLATDCLASADQKHAMNTSAMTSSCIESEEHLPYAEDISSELSAEVVGLSLISKFDEKHLPKVSELKWLVSDDDTPQNLLPIPDLTSSSNPDEHVVHSVTRGTKYWAPPRQQIIFTDHPTPNRKELLKKQNYRCAGCGMRVSPQYVHSFRYCTYLGKYHCTGCHRNQMSATPGKILQMWDFKCYPVSVFAYRLLEQMSTYPLFYLPDLNISLYVQSKSLWSARNKRLQLKYVKDFVNLCRFAVREQSYFESVPDYITSDIDNWSMADFIDTRSKCLHRSIDELIIKCENHIFNCVLCTARGFLCEYCHSDNVIYPWQQRVERCDSCGTCFHRKCWTADLCCRCHRLNKRHDEKLSN